MAKAKTRTYIKHIHKLTDDEYRQCYKLNLGQMGLMRDKLLWEKEKDYSTARVFLLKDLESKNILSWSLVFNHRKGEGAYFFTPPKLRRNGYGRRIAQHVQRYNPNVAVFPCNVINERFFATTKFTNLDRGYY